MAVGPLSLKAATNVPMAWAPVLTPRIPPMRSNLGPRAFPLPGCHRSIHPLSNVAYTQSPPFEESPYIPITQHTATRLPLQTNATPLPI